MNRNESKHPSSLLGPSPTPEVAFRDGNRDAAPPTAPPFFSRGTIVGIGAVWCLFWIGLFGLSGVLTSGWHLMDDSVILAMTQAIQKGEGFFSILHRFSTDPIFPFATRFGFIGAFLRLVRAWFFLDNLFLWQLFQALLLGITSTLLALGLRLLRFPWTEAVLYPGMIALGPQIQAWLRLSPGESWGTFFFSLFLFGLGRVATVALSRDTVSSPSSPLGLRLGLSGSLLLLGGGLMTLCKESFIPFLPALLALSFFLPLPNPLAWPSLLRRVGIGIVLFLFFLSLVEVGWILARHEVGKGIAMGEVLPRLTHNAILFFPKSDGPLALLSVGGLMWAFRRGNASLKEWRRLGALVLMVLGGVLLPQLLLHTLIGKPIEFRYRLPTLLGTALLNLYCWRGLVRYAPRLRKVFLILAVGYCLYGGASTWKWAKLYAQEGHLYTSYLQIMKKNIPPSLPVLIIADLRRDFEMIEFFSYFLPPTPLYLLPYAEDGASPDPHLLPHFQALYQGCVLDRSTPAPSVGAILLVPDVEPDTLLLHPSYRERMQQNPPLRLLLPCGDRFSRLFVMSRRSEG